MAQRTRVTGARSSITWLLILIATLLTGGFFVGALVLYPKYQQQQGTEQHYQAGVVFQAVGDWEAAEAEFKQVVSLSANYKDVQPRLAEVRSKRQAPGATAQATTEASPPATTPASSATSPALPRPQLLVEVAAGKPASASSFYQGSAPSHAFPPSNLVDRQTAESADCGPGPQTYWLLADKQVGWAEIDLQGLESISKIRWLNTHNGRCGDRATTKFHIELSPTGTFRGEQLTVYYGTMVFAPTPSYQEIVLPSPIKARYVRFYVDEYYNWGGGLNELEVYAEGVIPTP
jgi:hypothetical protein